jgi:esterase/lipase superfamily enzyme
MTKDLAHKLVALALRLTVDLPPEWERLRGGKIMNDERTFERFRRFLSPLTVGELTLTYSEARKMLGIDIVEYVASTLEAAGAPDDEQYAFGSSEEPAADESSATVVSGGNQIGGNYDKYNVGWAVTVKPVATTQLPDISNRAASPSPRKNDKATLVRVFYATDREQVIDKKGRFSYGEKRSTAGILNYGLCEVSIPTTHKIGKLESPSFLRFEFRPNTRKHIVLSATQGLAEKTFFEDIAASISRSRAKDAFVFVHGYNVSFQDAARRTGQIAFDLKFVGAPIFYSWPSGNKVAAYLKDETNISWSAPHFLRFLELLSQRSGANRVHIIAHSMGNRAVCEALKELSYRPQSQIRFNHLVLAAPDLDADTFRELASRLQGLSGRITIYQSSKDKAIMASKKVHGNPRAGEPLLVIPGLDTVDASSVDTDFLAHSYFSDNWPLLSDIHSLLSDDRPAAERFGLEARQHADGAYYAFRS